MLFDVELNKTTKKNDKAKIFKTKKYFLSTQTNKTKIIFIQKPKENVIKKYSVKKKHC